MTLNVNAVFRETWRQYVNSILIVLKFLIIQSALFCDDDTGWYKNVFIFFRLEVTYCFFLPLKGYEF